MLVLDHIIDISDEPDQRGLDVPRRHTSHTVEKNTSLKMPDSLLFHKILNKMS